jgi:hypothetical protein
MRLSIYNRGLFGEADATRQFDRSTPEGRQATMEFARKKKAEGAVALGKFIRKQSEKFQCR